MAESLQPCALRGMEWPNLPRKRFNDGPNVGHAGFSQRRAGARGNMTQDLFMNLGGTLVANRPEITSVLERSKSATASYPHKAGWKALGTSKESAENVKDVQESHKLILKVLESGNFTSDEIASKLGMSILYIRPRCTELKALGLLSKSGLRRENSSGQSANVLCLRQH